MAAHLARHLSGSHGIAASGKKGKKKSGRKPGRPKGSGKGRRMGSMSSSVAGVNLASLSADDLGRIIVAARSEIERRIADLRSVIG